MVTVMVRKTPFLFLLDFLDFLTLLDKLNIQSTCPCNHLY